ncbi:hypothetical protein C8R45DRAFT_948135 [Mycena sanguinolenta]|nr:hypothetical protein C8R45DRAFT_948135 [Mycena sanguinolenta]
MDGTASNNCSGCENNCFGGILQHSDYDISNIQGFSVFKAQQIIPGGSGATVTCTTKDCPCNEAYRPGDTSGTCGGTGPVDQATRVGASSDYVSPVQFFFVVQSDSSELHPESPDCRILPLNSTQLLLNAAGKPPRILSSAGHSGELDMDVAAVVNRDVSSVMDADHGIWPRRTHKSVRLGLQLEVLQCRELRKSKRLGEVYLEDLERGGRRSEE